LKQQLIQRIFLCALLFIPKLSFGAIHMCPTGQFVAGIDTIKHGVGGVIEVIPFCLPIFEYQIIGKNFKSMPPPDKKLAKASITAKSPLHLVPNFQNKPQI